MFLIQTLLDSLGVSSDWLQLVYGAILLFAIVLSSVLARSGRSVVAPAEPATA
jgi:ribose/xylose/arabinose/galactoside ABC-type transport system permease subunit